tara:strand:+ start:7285 stop:7539 length:255 start_codon:yes stop_codon:yes gene_type:complete
MKKLDSKSIDKLVGENLKRIREEQGKSQQHIGDLIELTNQQISKFERGINGFNVSQLYVIAQDCDVDMNYFFDLNKNFTEVDIY